MDFPKHIDTVSMDLSILDLTLKVSIMTAADNKFWDMFPSFWQK